MTRLAPMVAEIMESDTADQAKKMGLTYGGYGKWKDAQGNTVAKTVNGQLVKIGADDVATAPDAEGDDAPDDLDAVAGPVKREKGLGKLLSQAGGDTIKLRKQLMKTYTTGDAQKKEKAKKALMLLDKHEKAESDKADAAIKAVADRKAAELQARKAKYAPSPQI